MKRVNKFLALLLTITLLFSMFSLNFSSASAATVDDSNSSLTNEVDIQGTSSVGTMISDLATSAQDDQEENNGCNIFSIEVTDNIATVDFETTIDAFLIVGIYTESEDTLLASGTAEVEQGETSKEVTIDTDSMPDYFYLKGYLVDSENNKPICTAYSSPNYTQEMQEFLDKSTTDFEESKILNFDDSQDNNFAVYNDDVMLISSDTYELNTSTADEATDNTYVIENIDESISSLQEGDIISYNYSDGNALIIKVASISIDGTTATITGEEASMDEVFDYVKIDSTAQANDYVVDESTLSDGIEVYHSAKEVESVGAFNFNGSITKKLDFSAYYKPNDNISISGSISFSVITSLKVYVSLSYQYLELKIDKSATLKLAFSASISHDFELVQLGVSPVPGVYISITPIINFKVEGSVTLSGELNETTGFSYSSSDGFKNISTSPEFTPKFKMTGKLYVGFSLKVEVAVLGATVKGSLTGSAGIELSLSQDDTSDTDLKKHNCSVCYKGAVNAKLSLYVQLKFLDLDKFSFKYTLADLTYKIYDVYLLANSTTIQIGTCPNISYKISITVKNADGSNASGATVNSTATDSNGTAVFYLSNGKYNFTIVNNGEYKSLGFNVSNAPQSISVQFSSDSSSTSSYDFTNSGEIADIQLGSSHSIVLMKDGTAYTWGSNSHYQLGNFANTSSNKPTKLNGSISGIPENSIKAIATGEFHSAVITNDGSLYVWGYNSKGQVGDGTTTIRTTPVKIMDNVVSVSLGDYHSAAITTDGSLYVWGYNSKGQVGDGTTTIRTTPVKIMDNVASVSLGECHSAAITTDGSLYVWGYNYYGQVGNGTTTDQKTPVKIMDNVASVSLGGNHSATISKDGNLYIWGGNYYGQIGNGSTLRPSTSSATPGVSSPQKVAQNIAKVSLGDRYTLALSKDGGVYSWGYNNSGQLGDGTTTDSNSPVKIMSNVVNIEAGSSHGGAVAKDGTLYMWGSNSSGQLGNGTTTSSYSPIAVEVYDYTPTLTSSGIIYGNVSVNNSYDFTNSGEIADIQLGSSHSIVLMKDGTAYTWGSNSFYQLGNFANTSSNKPTKLNGSVSGIPENSIKAIATGGSHSAVITNDGSLYVWGYNSVGQVGNGTTTTQKTPVKIMDNVASVSLGDYHSAAITTDGSLYVWGDNYRGQVGDGTTTDRTTPVKIMDNVASVSLGECHSAAITTDGSLYVWGYNYYGQVGNGTTTTQKTPVKIMDNVASVSLGGNHSAAISKDGNLYIFGGNYYGQIGNGSTLRPSTSSATPGVSSPQKVAQNIAKVSLGDRYTLALSKDGGVYSWGYNNSGQLGDGTTTDSNSPVKIMSNVVNIEAGSSHGGAVAKDGTLYMWGYNNYGQLGNGTTTSSYSPIAVEVYDYTPYLSAKSVESVSASNTTKSFAIAGLRANGVYNFYAVKDKNADNILSSDNLVYINQYTADSNGRISSSYVCGSTDSCYEFVASLSRIKISACDITVNDLDYNGGIQSVEPEITYNGMKLYKDIDYTLSGDYYSNQTGEFTFNIEGKGDFVGSVTTTYTVNTVSVSSLSCDFEQTQYYSGSKITPTLTITNNGNTLVQDTDYTVSYQNNTDVGIGIIVVNGINNYTGRSVLWFDIEYLAGDVDGDGVISVKDATTIQKYLVALISEADCKLECMDVNGDGEISITDATQIQKYIVGLITT